MNMHIPVPPKRIVALGGPVSAAIRAMRADEPATDYTRIRELRRAIADRIEADIALLDALDPFRDELEADQMVGRFDAHGHLYHVGVSTDDEECAGDSPEHDPAEDGIADADGLAEQYAGTRYAYQGAV